MRGENDSKQLDEFQAKFYLNRMDFVTEMFSRERPKEDEKLMNIPGGGGMKGIWGSEAKLPIGWYIDIFWNYTLTV